MFQCYWNFIRIITYLQRSFISFVKHISSHKNLLHLLHLLSFFLLLVRIFIIEELEKGVFLVWLKIKIEECVAITGIEYFWRIRGRIIRRYSDNHTDISNYIEIIQHYVKYPRKKWFHGTINYSELFQCYWNFIQIILNLFTTFIYIICETYILV